jgi:hypothetical protein
MLFADLLESRAFRNQHTFEKYTVDELKELFYLYMLTLNILVSGEPSKAIHYARKTLAYPTYDGIRLSVTDLANIITVLLDTKKYLDGDVKHVPLPILEIKRYFRGVERVNGDPELTRRLFLKLQTRLKLNDGYTNMLRRESLDFSSENAGTRKATAERIYREFRKKAYRADIVQDLHEYLEHVEKTASTPKSTFTPKIKYFEKKDK